MYHIHGINISSNTTKTVYVAEELGIDFKYTNLDLSRGEHKTPEHLARHPLGKIPTLTHDGETLFESGAICRYLASVESSEMYPIGNHLKRCRVDQWMDLFSNHVGRWLNSYAFEKVAKAKYGFGEPNKAAEDEALGFIEQQMPAVEDQLGKGRFLLGDDLTIADNFAFAYMEMAELSHLPMGSFPNVSNWYQEFKNRDSVLGAKKKLGLA